MLRTAADEPAAPPDDAEAGVEARQRQLWEQPFDVSFRELAQQIPELRELERRVVDDPEGFLHGLTFRDTGRIGGPPPRADRQDGQALLLVALRTAIRRLVGPGSGRSHPVLASEAAERVAWHHLLGATGIDLRTSHSR